MRIGFYCSSTSWGGLEINVWRFAGWMQSRGHEVSVFCVDGSPLFERSQKHELSTIAVARNKKYGDFNNARRLAALFEQHNIELVWIRDTRDMSVVGMAKRRWPMFKILYQQAMQLGVDKKDFIHTRRFKPIDFWISPLKFLADQVKGRTRFAPERIYQIPLALDIERFDNFQSNRPSSREQFGINKDVILLGIIGRLDPQKGQQFVLECLPEIRAKHEHVELLLVGETTKGEHEDYLTQLNRFVRENHLSEHVHFHPFINDPLPFYDACDAMVMASEGETFGMVTIEAMLAGCSVIGTNSSGTPEILNQGELGLLYNVNDKKGFLTAVDSFMGCPEKVEKMTRLAAESARSNYSHSHVCKQIEQVITG